MAASAVNTSSTGVPKNAGAKTQLRTLAFMACMAAMATFGSAASNPHMVEQTQAKKKPNIAPANRSDRRASGLTGSTAPLPSRRGAIDITRRSRRPGPYVVRPDRPPGPK